MFSDEITAYLVVLWGLLFGFILFSSRKAHKKEKDQLTRQINEIVSPDICKM